MSRIKIIIELDDDFCKRCFMQINQFLNLIGFKMTRMKKIEDVDVYKWVESDG